MNGSGQVERICKPSQPVSAVSLAMRSMPPSAKPLRGFGGAGVLELIEDYSSNTYRAVYTVRFAGKIYVLHVFQKKSKRGVATPRQDLDLIRNRLKLAEALYTARSKEV